MAHDDVEPLVDVCADALWGAIEEGDRPIRRDRITHLLASDPAGAWVAEHAGAPVGCSMALVREGLWGLSLLALAEEHRTGGTGRGLLRAALTHARDARAAIILSSEHPAAMRIYARAGFALHPTVSLNGLVTNPPEPAHGVREAGEGDIAWMDEVARAVRGAGYGADLAWWLEHSLTITGVRDRGFLVGRGPRVVALLARDDEAATDLLRTHLAQVAPGESVELLFVAAGQDWAVQAGLEAGLALTPDGPLFTRGMPAPDGPWIPSGAFL